MFGFGPSNADLAYQLRLLQLSVNYVHQEVRKIMSSQDQLANDLNAVTAQVAKIGAETSVTLQKVIDLEAALAAAGGTTPAVDAALAALKAQAQATDDLIPDAPAA